MGQRSGSSEKKVCRDRRGEILFIDARQVGYMKDRVLRDFRPEDIARIADTFHAWQSGDDSGRKSEIENPKYEDVPGFCRSATVQEVQKHDYVLTPGRYVGAAEGAEDGEAFADKMARLTRDLGEQFAESERLEAAIRRNLSGFGWMR